MLPKTTSNPSLNTYQNLPYILANILTILLGSFYFGFTLTYFNSIPIYLIISIFHIHLTPTTAQGLFSGLIPIGAAIGAILSSLFNTKLSRRYLMNNILGVLY
jgi:hypothetical protein